MLSVARSRFALLSQFLFLIVNAIGILFGVIYNGQTPDLYENNAHHKIGWIASCVVAVQVVMSLIFTYAGRGDADVASASSERAAFLPVSTDDMVDHHHHHHHHHFPSTSLHQYRWSGDSSQGTEPSSASPASPSSIPAEFDDDEKPATGARRWLRNTVADRFFASRIPGMVSNRVLSILSMIYVLIDRIIIPFGFIAIATGGVTFGGIMVSYIPLLYISTRPNHNLSII